LDKGIAKVNELIEQDLGPLTEAPSVEFGKRCLLFRHHVDIKYFL
jgi:hypothetical protein